jgi:hypothetical protein
MYAKVNLTGDGVVENNCAPSYRNKEFFEVIPGNLGVYSGCCPLPNNNGHLYKVSSYYEPMPEYKQGIKFESKLGLTPMPDYKIVDNAIGGKGIFYPSDGRVIDAVRDMKLVLDKPAETGSVDMDLVSNFNNSNYASVYRSYGDIKNGQIGYYVDPAVSQPFIAPVYTLSSYVDKTIFKDPMDSVKPEYIKKPLVNTLYSTSSLQDTRDQLFFREDLMSRQQNLYNRTSWVNRWVKP